MWLELGPRLRVVLTDVDRHAPAHLLGLRIIPGLLTLLAEHAEDALEAANMEIWQPHVGVPSLGDKLYGLQTADARNPDRRVRLLQRPRPGIDILEEVMLAVPS